MRLWSSFTYTYILEILLQKEGNIFVTECKGKPCIIGIESHTHTLHYCRIMQLPIVEFV